MDAERHGEIEAMALPAIARLIGCPNYKELSLVAPHEFRPGHVQASVYWQAWFVCEATIHVEEETARLCASSRRFGLPDAVYDLKLKVGDVVEARGWTGLFTIKVVGPRGAWRRYGCSPYSGNDMLWFSNEALTLVGKED